MARSDYGINMISSESGSYYWDDAPVDKLVFFPKGKSKPTKEWVVTTALEALRIALQEDGIKLELK